MDLDTPDLGYRLRLLREHAHPLASGPYSFAQLRDELARRGVKVSDSHLRNVFAGKVTNPSFPLMSALADIFKVSVAVFSYDEDEWKSIESWLVTTSAEVSQRKLAAARGLRRRDSRAAKKINLVGLLDAEGTQPTTENDHTGE